MKKLTRISLMLAAASSVFAASAAEISKFPIGTTWPDTDGIHINCHGGCVVPYDGAFYWFGESRTGGHSDGISVYRSTDLYNWKNMGFAVTHGGERDDANLQDISEGRLLERPKVIYNASTDKWVMWAHWENGSDYGQARVAILQADKITGPYTFVSTMRPNGHDSRDQTLFLDSDGKAYHFCSTNMNTDINVVRLSDDFLGCSADEKLIMKGRRLEATTVCKYGDTYFATFSECNGWDPAPGHSATAAGDMLGDWTEGLNFCVDPDENRSYRSQGAFVFSVEALGYDPKCFIFYGDRWNSKNVGGSTYVWLPLSIRSGYPTVRNLSDGWNLDEVMRDMYRYKRAAAITPGAEFSLLERNSDRLLSRTGMVSGFCIKDDDERVNCNFIFESTDNPYIWRLRSADSGRYLAVRGNALIEDNNGSADNSAWEFVLLPDGYYRIINRASGLCLSVVDNRRYDGSTVGIAAPREGASQAFGVYFDSRRHPDYTEADMYSAAYRTAIAGEIARQDYKPQTSRSEFVAGRPYAVEHYSSARMLTLTEKGATIADMTKAANQKITFVPTAAGATTYNIVDADGRYLAKDPESGWLTVCGSDIDPKSDEAIFTVEDAGYGYIIRNKATGLLVGPDAVGEGSTVYCNKNGDTNPLYQWNFTDFDAVVMPSDEDRFIEALATIDTAFGPIEPSQVGNAPFDYATTAYEAMKSALEHAVVAKDNYDAERTALEEAWAKFQDEGTVPPDPACAYRIRHAASGLYMAYSADNSSPILSDDAVSDATRFIFAADGTNDGAYAIRNIRSSLYVGRSTESGNIWVMGWNEDPAIKQSLWKVAFSPVGGKAFYNLQTKGYIGSDAGTDGATLYCNKSNTESFAQWEIAEAGESGVTATPVNTAVNITRNGMAIRVSSASGDVTARIYDTTGRLVGISSGTIMEFTPGRGLYIVSVSGEGTPVTCKIAL